MQISPVIPLVGCLSDIEEIQPELRKQIEPLKKEIFRFNRAAAHQLLKKLLPNIKNKEYKKDLQILWNAWACHRLDLLNAFKI